MPKGWQEIRVRLLRGGGMELDPPPGRVFLVGPKHTFAELAHAINAAFARWDISHLHAFKLADGSRIGVPEGDFDTELEDEDRLAVCSVLAQGDRFSYVFDLGDGWTHECVVEHDEVDVVARYGDPPVEPVPVWGWGWIPDQYGRESENEGDE